MCLGRDKYATYVWDVTYLGTDKYVTYVWDVTYLGRDKYVAYVPASARRRGLTLQHVCLYRCHTRVANAVPVAADYGEA